MRREVLLIGEMVDAVEQILQLTERTTEADINADRLRRDALLWNFTVLGEAAAQLPQDIQEQHPNVPWQQPTRLRNRIVHGYWSIDVGVLLTTAATQLPAFLDALRAVQATFEEPPDP
jgi:uncharacterized protein with HEPN domain